MKKRLRIFQIALSAVSALIAFLYVMLEGQKILCGDWLLHEQPSAALLQFLLRLGISAGIFFSSLRQISGKRQTVYESLCITVSCAVMAVLLPNGVGILFFGLSALQLAAVGLQQFHKNMRERKNNPQGHGVISETIKKI